MVEIIRHTPEFASRLNLFDRMLNALTHAHHEVPVSYAMGLLSRGSISGALQAEIGAAYGLDIRDPTADARVLAFTLSVPDHIFIDPQTGLDRMLIREAMKDRLPDEVRLNCKTGIQAADLVPRLRACACEVEDALSELEGGHASSYVNVPYMRKVWGMIQTQDTPEAFRKAVTILTRGIMAGLWVNDFYDKKAYHFGRIK